MNILYLGGQLLAIRYVAQNGYQFTKYMLFSHWIYKSVAIIFTFYYRCPLAAPLFVNMPWSTSGSNKVWKCIKYYYECLEVQYITFPALHSSFFICFVGIRRDLVSEPRKPDVYLAVNPVAFGSQLDDEIDENERCVFLLIVRFVWVYRISTNRRL